jgi:glycosyltransferase involved in cell wall biosynthesis
VSCRRIAHLTTVDSSLQHLIRAQLVEGVRRGDEVIAISCPGPYVAQLERDGIRHAPIPSSTRGMDLRADLRAARELWRILRRERVDVLHTHNPKPGLYGRVIGRLAGVPVVVNTNHGLYATADDPLSKRALVLALEAFATRFSHAELVQNPEDLALLVRWHAVDPRRTRLLGNGIDLDRFDPRRLGPSVRAEARTELGIADDEVVVGTVARLVAEKGYLELFAAAPLLGPRTVVIAAGAEDPQKADALSPVALARARSDGVRLLGHRDDIERLYAAMDVFVLASHREGFPRAAMEAASMGLPVVATDVRGCREVVRPGLTGLVFPRGDVAALARAVKTLVDHPGQRDRMGRASRALALERFDERDVVRAVFDTYDDPALGGDAGDTRADSARAVRVAAATRAREASHATTGRSR